jgi:hypothetical protein
MSSLVIEQENTAHELDSRHMIEVYHGLDHASLLWGINVRRYTVFANPFLVIMQFQLWLELLGFTREMMCFVS